MSDSDNKVRRVEHEDGTATYTVEVTMETARVFDSILEAARVEGVSGNEFMVGAAAVRVCALSVALAKSASAAAKKGQGLN